MTLPRTNHGTAGKAGVASKQLNVCQDITPVFEYIRSLEKPLSKKTLMDISDLVEKLKDDMFAAVSTISTEELKQFGLNGELDSVTDKARARMPEVPRDIFK